MTRAEASIGSLLFLFLAPGTVAGLIPWTITHWRARLEPSQTHLIIGVVLLVLGAALLLECFARFAFAGRGTPAPIAPTQRLVVSGAYRFVRNPMYVAVLALIFGQMFVFQHAGLLAYGIVIWMAFQVFVLAYEEPTLKRDYGDEYRTYAAHVPRWIPRLTPWRGPET